MTTTSNNEQKYGRLCNQIIRNMAVSFVAERHNLYVDYSSKDRINRLGIELFCGENKHNNSIWLTDHNYFHVLDSKELHANLLTDDVYFQTPEISNLIYNHFRKEDIQPRIVQHNPFRHWYNNNNDLFVHVRLGDVAKYTPGLDYYVNAISEIKHENLFVSSDDYSHDIIKGIFSRFPHAKTINYEEVRTIQFGSTCKHVVLSHGSFSAVIGFLSFFSDVCYPEYEPGKIWFGDMFSGFGWKMRNRTPLHKNI
jgi:hypothetical protein